ncbi:hypothetical protein FN846DRAFT_82332 [Sphaerosporella brunnea]|uniref:Xylanolytic transcriptional activator regulatory domain-containing protein n=1 Tax=Sphaerosporella brunnea TaxID=1250544 RepID=A0A5J5F945_9PEZI|nr:hypothetical protein FN846DRAFT_82332 [Sphaerosporella brunnea]
MIPCKYAVGKRESARRKLRELEDKVQSYEALLRELQNTVDLQSKHAIQKALAGSLTPTTETSEDIDIDSEDESHHRSGDETSDNPPETLSEDINTLSINNPNGFMGRGSEVSWLKLLRHELNIDDNKENEHLREIRRMKGDAVELNGPIDMVGVTYHLDDIDLSLDGSNVQIDPYLIPPKPIADTLVSAYFCTVHPLVPIISKPEFMAIYNRLNTEGPMVLSRHDLMVINLVFAAGGRCLETLGRDPQWPHMECFNRARVLGALDGGVLFGIPMLHDVQAMGLTGLYLLGSKHTNRAWNVVGLGIRLAHGLGLHLRTEDPKLDPQQREMRVRVYYALVYLEATLCLVTGRPTTLQAFDMAGPVPRSALITDGSPDAYYSALMKLSMIIAVVQSQLYASRSAGVTRTKKWGALSDAICSLRSRLDHWKSELPANLDFEITPNDPDVVIQRSDLALRYYNTMILIYFPCLARRDAPQGSWDCLNAARSILSLIVLHTDNDTPQYLPWWCLPHYLVCAEVVVMLAIVRHDDLDLCEQLVEEVRKPLRWLRHISRLDLVAQRTEIQLGKMLGHVLDRLAERRRQAAAITRFQS